MHDFTDDRKRWAVNFGERLEMIRKNKSMPRKVLMRRADIAQGSYEGYIYAHHEPTAYVIFKLCKVLGVSADVLLGLEDE